MPVEYVIRADLTVKPSKLFVIQVVWLLFADFSDPDTSSLDCKSNCGCYFSALCAFRVTCA